MEQTFEYPNLLTGTRDHMSLYSYNNPVRPVALAAAPGGVAYALVNADAIENYLWTSLADLRHGKEYALSLWMASTDNCSSTDVFAIDTEDGHYGAIDLLNKVKPPFGGGWYSWKFSVKDSDREGKYYRLRIDNNGSTDGRESTLYVADVMLTEGTEPRAWAPSEGEVWPE